MVVMCRRLLLNFVIVSFMVFLLPHARARATRARAQWGNVNVRGEMEMETSVLVMGDRVNLLTTTSTFFVGSISRRGKS